MKLDAIYMIFKKYPKLSVLSIAALIAWLSTILLFSIDTTRQQRNSLTSSTIELLKRINGPVTIKAFVADIDNSKNIKTKLPAAKIRKIITRFIAQFKKYKADISLELIDHSQDMKTATQYGVVTSQAIIIEYNGQSKALKRLDQFSFIYTLLQLQKKKQTWIVFMEGHGERTPHQKGNGSLADLGDRLKLRNNNVQALNIEKHSDIPQNTQVLVIASPKKAYSLKALGSIIRYINKGGNLLWLHDPHNKSSLELLSNKLGIKVLPGLIIAYNHKQQKTMALILDKFPHDKLTQKLNGHLALFPQVSAIIPTLGSRFKIKTILTSKKTSWNETTISNKTTRDSLKFDANTADTKGPISFGLKLTRTLARNKRQQRIIVIGDSDFLSNGFIGRGANRSLAMNIFAWLSQRDELIDVDRPKISDHLLHFSSWTALLLFILFALILPATLITVAVVHYRRRLRRE